MIGFSWVGESVKNVRNKLTSSCIRRRYGEGDPQKKPKFEDSQAGRKGLGGAGRMCAMCPTADPMTRQQSSSKRYKLKSVDVADNPQGPAKYAANVMLTYSGGK